MTAADSVELSAQYDVVIENTVKASCQSECAEPHSRDCRDG